jgi:hypothetical protein
MPSNISDRRWLCEGWIDPGCDDGVVFYPDLRYVRQGAKVFVFEGREKMAGSMLNESVGANAVTLVESLDAMELIERKLPNGVTMRVPKDGVWEVEGVSQRSDVLNANKRKYPRKIWERLIGDPKSYVMQKINERGMIGHLEHPKDGRTDGKEGALVVTGSRLLEDGTVRSKFELLDTPNGLILQEYTRKGVKWGVSSRGNGQTDEGGNVIPDTFVFETWDAVMSPSTPGAFPTLVQKNESTNESTILDTMAKVKAIQDRLDTIANAPAETGVLEIAEGFRILGESSASLTPDEVIALHEKLKAKITAAAVAAGSTVSASLDRVIDEAVDAGTQTETPPAAVQARVIDKLHEQLQTLCVESDSLRQKLESTDAQVALLISERDDMRDRLSLSETDAEALRKKLTIASELLSERTERIVEIRRVEVPAPILETREPRPSRAATVPLPPIPMGVVSESIKPNKPATGVSSPGANLAAAALRKSQKT